MFFAVAVYQLRATEKVQTAGADFLRYLIVLAAPVDMGIESRRSGVVDRAIGHDAHLIPCLFEVVCDGFQRRTVRSRSYASADSLLPAGYSGAGCCRTGHAAVHAVCPGEPHNRELRECEIPPAIA